MSISNNTTQLQNVLEIVNTLPEAKSEPILQDKTVTPDTNQQIITAGEGYDGLNIVTVEGDENLVAGNIKNGVSIFGVSGTLEEIEVEDALITRTISVYESGRVTSIGSHAFHSCSSLTSVSFPDCTNIGSYAFFYCYSLKSVSFPVCTSIGNSAFYGCSSLTSVNFPDCTNIGSYAFYSCSSLTSVNFPLCASIEGYAFAVCKSLKSVSFPDCTNVGLGAFSYCRTLTTVSLPACTTIGSSAFRDCYTLISLYLIGSSLCTLSKSNAFTSTPIGGYSASAGCYGSIYVPQSLLASYQAATNWTYFSSRFVGIQSNYTVTYNISSDFSLDNMPATVAGGSSFVTKLIDNSNAVPDVTVEMNGVDITDSAVINGENIGVDENVIISISSVTGDIVITIVTYDGVGDNNYFG